MSQVERVLVIGLSNVGDAVLMSPVMTQLRRRYPTAHLTLLAGERARHVFLNDGRIQQVIALEEFAGVVGRLRLVGWMWRLKPDLLIDLRGTLLPLCWRPWRAVFYYWPIPRQITHMRARHLWKLRQQLPGVLSAAAEPDDGALSLGEAERASVDQLLTRWNIRTEKPLVVICPGARSHIKRWGAERFAAVADRLIAEAGVELVLTGEPDEAPIADEIRGAMRQAAHSAVGRTTIRQLAALLQRAALVITNDSAALHLAGAVRVPVLALFGPTDPRKYGPTGRRDRVIQRRLFCVPCEQALCRFNHECMRFMSVEEVYEAARHMLRGQGAGDGGAGEMTKTSPRAPRPSPRRILVIRLDRIGDVVLSTPVLQELRRAYPQAFVAMIVRPVCRELVEGNPFLTTVILYDKQGAHRGVWATIRFAWGLRQCGFDTALVLHPSNRSHWIPWLAGIPVRIGYDHKSAWLLTHRLPHLKHQGIKHEAEYTIEMLHVLGLEPPTTLTPVVPIHPDAEQRIARLLTEQGIDSRLTLIALHPSASDESKRWPTDRFAQLADRLIDEQRAQIVLVAGPDEVEHARAVERVMRHRPLNLAGTLSVGALACLFKRCRLLVSNDSGPVHVAAAVGIPVVALFGRSQPGINATRWRPLGTAHLVLQKPDDRRFSSMTDFSVDEVYRAARTVLTRSSVASAILA